MHPILQHIERTYPVQGTQEQRAYLVVRASSFIADVIRQELEAHGVHATTHHHPTHSTVMIPNDQLNIEM